ncbi:MAG: hypothetical protein AAFN78_20990 [Pseudomonadota bacterium]
MSPEDMISRERDDHERGELWGLAWRVSLILAVIIIATVVARS